MQDYLNLITSQHRQQPKFIAMLNAYMQKLEDAKILLDSWNFHFDLEEAYGVQLDILGILVGRGRILNFQPANYSSRLDDENYRICIKSKILQNQWDGTNQGLYDLFKQIFPDLDLIIRDNQDMSMRVTVIGMSNALQKELIERGYIIPKPQGVEVIFNVIESKIFAYDREDESFAGYDRGEWM